MREIININQGIPGEEIPASNWALDKLMTIAEIMEHCEFRSISISQPGEHKGIIQDFNIPKQIVREARAEHTCHMDYVEDYEALRKQGSITLGIAHGHGYLDPFHSFDDDDAFDGILFGSWTHNKAIDYLGFDFTDSKPKKEGDIYVIKGFNETDLDLLLETSKFSEEEVRRIRDNLKARVLKRIRGEVSSIVVNHTCRYVYGIKRIREHTFFLFPEEKARYEEIARNRKSNFSKKGNVVKYNLETVVRGVDIGDKEPVKREELLDELKERITFDSCRKPSTFRKKIIVGVPHPVGVPPLNSYAVESFSGLIVDYLSSRNPYAFWAGKVALRIKQQLKEGINATFSDNVYNLNRTNIPCKLDDAFRNVYTQVFAKALSNDTSNNNELVVRLINDTNRALLYQLFPPNKSKTITANLETYIPLIIQQRLEKRKAEKAQKKRSVESLEQEKPENIEAVVGQPDTVKPTKEFKASDEIVQVHTGVPQCNPFESTDEIFDVYRKKSFRTTDYMQLLSINYNIESIIAELKSMYGPEMKLVQKLSVLYKFNQRKLQKEIPEFRENVYLRLEKTLNRYHTSKKSASVNEKQQITFYKEFLGIRDNLYAIDDTEKAQEVYEKMREIQILRGVYKPRRFNRQ